MLHRVCSRIANKAAVPACLLAVTLLPLGFANAALAQGLDSGSTLRLAGQTPPQVLNGRATLVSHYEPTQKLRLAIVLAVPHPAEEKQFLEDVQNVQSPKFHQFLSAEEWNARFGPSVENEQAVVDWATSQGLTVTHRFANRLAVDLEAPAGMIEKALNVTIDSYLLPAENGVEARTVYSNDRDPELPSRLSGVVDAVLGLNSVLAARPAGGSGRLVPRPDYVAGPVVQMLDSKHQDALVRGNSAEAAEASPSSVTPPKTGYWTPQDMFSSYAYDYQALMNQGHCCNPLDNTSGHSPRESSIAIASFGDVSLTDVSNFHQAFPYLAYYVDKIGIDGGYACNNTAKAADDNCVEVTLDTEWSLAMANSQGAASNTARVVVYEGSTYSNAVIMDVYNQMLEDAHARTMSTSWGWEENSQFSSNPEMDTYFATMQSVDKVFSSMVGQGWTLVAATGDQGATAGCSDAVRIQFPSSDPNVVAAGGTQLIEGTPYEVGWTGGTGKGACSKNGGGSTGGFSVYWGEPSYQSGLKHSKRAVPDLALDAYYGHDVYFNGGWIYEGGTSDVAPMLAGFFAQENAYLLAIGDKCGSKGTSACAPMGNANYPIYATGLHPNGAHDPFYDVTQGCNSNDITALYKLGYYCAGPGYDEVTGWGSANMLQLAWAINWELAPANGIPYLTYTGPATGKWYNTNQTVSWKVVDYAGNDGAPGTGISGETQSWDAAISDPYSEAHGWVGNSFYSGPQFPNHSTGCLAFEPNGCSGGVSQGCHTAHVRGWNNQGFSTGDVTYGPLCYDTVAPTQGVNIAPALPATGWHTSKVTVTLSAADPGGTGASGVAGVYYGLNASACSTKAIGSCSKYAAPFAVSAQGVYTLTSFVEDKAGNFSNVATNSIKIDETAPVTSVRLGGGSLGGIYETTVTVTLTATDNLSGVKTTYYSLDGATAVVYAGAFAVGTPGSHTLTYHSVDVAGNTEATHTLAFKIASPTVSILTVSPNPATAAGAAVTLTAKVEDRLLGTPAGTVTFFYGKTVLGTATLSAGKATLITTKLPVGTDSLTVEYAGETYYLASTSAAVSEVVK